MRTPSSGFRVFAIAATGALLLGACRPKPPETPPAPVPPAPEVRADAGPVAGAIDPSAGAVSLDAGRASLADAQGGTMTVENTDPVAGSGSSPGSASSGAAGTGNAASAVRASSTSSRIPPRLEDMHRAVASSKLGVPVDLRYQFDAPVEPGRPVTLHLAAVPRVEGENLTVSIREVPGVDAVAAPMTAQKASIAQAYRQQLSVTRHAGTQSPAELRVLVRMDVAEGSAFGYFSVPLEGGDAATAAQ